MLQNNNQSYSRTKTCYRTEYREEYVPGTEEDPGFVHSWKETIEFPCFQKVVLLEHQEDK